MGLTGQGGYLVTINVAVADIMESGIHIQQKTEEGGQRTGRTRGQRTEGAKGTLQDHDHMVLYSRAVEDIRSGLSTGGLSGPQAKPSSWLICLA